MIPVTQMVLVQGTNMYSPQETAKLYAGCKIIVGQGTDSYGTMPYWGHISSPAEENMKNDEKTYLPQKYWGFVTTKTLARVA